MTTRQGEPANKQPSASAKRERRADAITSEEMLRQLREQGRLPRLVNIIRLLLLRD